jgi:hypothetical protein
VVLASQVENLLAKLGGFVRTHIVRIQAFGEARAVGYDGRGYPTGGKLYDWFGRGRVDESSDSGRGSGDAALEETTVRPKPMVEIGGRPILWHILKIYSQHGINDFIICCGYKGYIIKEFFANYFLHTSDVTFDMQKQPDGGAQLVAEPWKVTLVDTGDRRDRRTAAANAAVSRSEDEPFCMTYGDGVATWISQRRLPSTRSTGRP